MGSALFFSLCLLSLGVCLDAQNECSQYVAKVAIYANVDLQIGGSLVLHCFYNCTSYRRTEWSHIDAKGTETEVYVHTVEDGTGPVGDYVGRVNLTHIPSSSQTTLTISALDCVDDGTWKCSVYSDLCAEGKAAEEKFVDKLDVPVENKDINLTVAGELVDSSELAIASASPMNISCSVVSHPPSVVSLDGVDEFESTCDGNCPQVCSASAINVALDVTKNVTCSVTYKGQQTLKTVELSHQKQGGLEGWAIALIVLAVIAVIVVVALVLWKKGVFQDNRVHRLN